MKYKFLLVNKTANVEYSPNGWLGRLKMFVGDERAVQVGSYTESKDRLKVEFNFKVKDQVYPVTVETLSYWGVWLPRYVFDGNRSYDGYDAWMSDVKDPKDVWITIETDIPITRFEYINCTSFSQRYYNNKITLTETTTNTVIFDKDTPSCQTISIDVPMRLHHRNKNTFITFK